jgi:hypothetical protein
MKPTLYPVIVTATIITLGDMASAGSIPNRTSTRLELSRTRASLQLDPHLNLALILQEPVPAAVPPTTQATPPPATPVIEPSIAGQNYESNPTLQASQILQPTYLSGPLFKVREQVANDWGVNQYVIDTPAYGSFIAHGNLLLLERLAEIQAMDRLDHMSKGEEYGKAVKQAAKAPLQAAEDLLDDPVDTLKKVPRGIGKFFRRIGEEVKEAETQRPRSEHEDDRIKNMLGVSRTKRKLCQKLGINPYSSNDVLQHKLDEMCWVLFAGDMTVTAATLPIDGGIGAVIKTTGAITRMDTLIYDQSPVELRTMNQQALEGMGLSEADAVAFLSNPAFSPWHQTKLVSSLQSMPDVTGRDTLVTTATTTSTEETDAIFYAESAQLLSVLHGGQLPIARIEMRNNAPYAILKDGSVLLALHWDYARWSPSSEKCLDWLATMQVDGRKPPSTTIALTGAASARLHEETAKRGFRLLDRQAKGPLN